MHELIFLGVLGRVPAGAAGHVGTLLPASCSPFSHMADRFFCLSTRRNPLLKQCKGVKWDVNPEHRSTCCNLVGKGIGRRDTVPKIRKADANCCCRIVVALKANSQDHIYCFAAEEEDAGLDEFSCL